MENKFKIMFKNKARLSFKLFILVWIVLFIQVVLKLTFNYWQPYVIPSPQLQVISNFVDNHFWIKIIFNSILYILSAVIVVLCGIQQYWFKNKFQTILSLSIITGCCILNYIPYVNNFTPFITTVALPLILNMKKWLYIILTFILSNVFLIISLLLNNFVQTDCNGFIIDNLFLIDYYIMLVLNYVWFNMIKDVSFKNIFKRGEKK